MKRIFALILSLIFVISLCGCGEKEEKKDSKIDMKYYGDLGVIPECEFALGKSGDEIVTALETKKTELESKDEHYYFDKIEGETNILITDGEYEYYYKKANPENGIVYMVSFADAYGFELGTVISEVKETLSAFNFEEKTSNEVDLFFYRGNIENTSVLQASFEKNTIMFVFEDNGLSATVIYSNENWN